MKYQSIPHRQLSRKQAHRAPNSQRSLIELFFRREHIPRSWNHFYQLEASNIAQTEIHEVPYSRRVSSAYRTSRWNSGEIVKYPQKPSLTAKLFPCGTPRVLYTAERVVCCNNMGILRWANEEGEENGPEEKLHIETLGSRLPVLL